MNKKYISICLSIFAISLIFILGFKFILGDKILYDDSMSIDEGHPVIKYTGFEEDENIYKIKVSIKNTSKYYANFSDINLQFLNKYVYSGNANPVFKGYDKGMTDYLIRYEEDIDEPSAYLDPNEEREYIFEVSKGLSFDKKVFDTNRMSISYDARYYKYKLNERMVLSSTYTSGRRELLDNSLEPFTID